MFRIDLRRLILWLCLLSVLVALGNSFYASYQVQRDILLTNTLEGNRAYAAKLAGSADGYIGSIHRELAYSAGILSDMVLRPALMEQEVERLAHQSDHYNSVVIVHADGTVAAMSPQLASMVGSQLSSNAVREALTQRKPLVSEPFIAATGRWVIIYSQPIFDKAGNYLGFVGGTLYLHASNGLHRLLGDHYYRDGSYLFVVDRHGTLIYHPDAARIGETVTSNKVVAAIMQGASGQEQVVNTHGVPMLAGFAVVASTGWGLVAQRPLAGTLQRMDELLWMTVRNSLPLLIILLFCIGWLSKLIARPLWELASVAKQIDENEASDRIRKVRSWYFESTELKRALLTGLGSINHKMRNLRRESTTDALTALLNRRGLIKAIDEFASTGMPVAVLAVDIDNFKSVNDRFGHDVGDDVIRSLATLMRNGSRSNDILARPGGEEFTVLLPGTSLEDAITAAERLRGAMHKTPNATGGAVTVSIGVARYPEHGKNLEGALKEADKALYHAKNAGRNLTCVAQPDGPDGYLAITRRQAA
ncbi:sensor domain-containing diguanylate cyclase [Achromobacter aloeverae]|uniref:diguanylate cyclase n=1 Tax=Achromobacter aloeverae TaxID=1750518 RepID=A0A4Q1HHY9_9BURK|nr:sensor domain-containing diguanylate cyclase [Achromobacter aloeverae]RXN87798.1 GGDEF domain-containing protein [Achromobacter aloeverae]